MYPPNVLVAPRLLDCVPPYVNSPFTSYIPPPVSLCLPPPAPSHLPPPPPHSCVRSRSASASWSWATVSPHQRGCLCCITALCPAFRDTCFFFFCYPFCILATCQTLGLDYKNWILDLDMTWQRGDSFQVATPRTAAKTLNSPKIFFFPQTAIQKKFL